MKRLLILLALIGAGTSFACGDDSGDDDQEVKDSGTQQPTDARVADSATRDAAPVVSRGVQITNLGAACTANSSCTASNGGRVECVTELLNIDIPGGFCTADCRLDDECGTNGRCPGATVLQGLSGLADFIAPIISGIIPQQCVRECDPRESDPCGRTGFTCGKVPVPAQIAAFVGTIPELNRNYCLPPTPDAGVPPRQDAGTQALIIQGLDAGL